MNHNTDTFKNELFQDADYLQISAREYYELADSYRSHGKFGAYWAALNDAKNAENAFELILEKLVSLGWDKEYMGICA